MNIGLLLYGIVMVVALGFGTWPLLSRASGIQNGWVMAIVMAVSALSSWAFHRPGLAEFPTNKALLWIVCAGLANGIGAVAYGRILLSPQAAAAGLPAVALTAMIVVMSVGGFLFFKDTVTTSKLVGLAFAAVGCYLLAK
jgi:uncharacterized membrane protein